MENNTQELPPLQGKKAMTFEEATAFFSEFYRGEHHIPGKIKPFGDGWVVNHDRGDLATYDYNELTRLVLMAHDKCVRVSVMPSSPRHIKIAIWQRVREGGMGQRHPTLEQAITTYNEYKQKEKDGK